MMGPLFFRHKSGIELAVQQASSGFTLCAFDPSTGRTLYGTEQTIEDALSWAEGARLILSDAEGSA